MVRLSFSVIRGLGFELCCSVKNLLRESFTTYDDSDSRN